MEKRNLSIRQLQTSVTKILCGSLTLKVRFTMTKLKLIKKEFETWSRTGIS